MSRIRQIKPSWFLDKDLRRGATADAREFYIGLWMLADDAGYLTWDPERIGAELYPFDQIGRRERNVERWARVLEELDHEAPHLVVWTCGHACVPKMVAHQRIAGTQTFTVARAHRGEPGSGPPEACRTARSRVSLHAVSLDVATNSPGRVGNGRERNGTVGNNEDDLVLPREGAREDHVAAERLLAHGLDPRIARKHS